MISVIIPTTGEIEPLERLCQSLRQQNFADDYEVLVISNPSNRKVRRLIESLPSQFMYFESEVRGANTARNIGIKNAQGRYLFFFDSDCRLPTPDFLKQGCDFFDQNPEVLATGGPYRPDHPLASRWDQAYYYIQNKWLYEGLREDGFHRYLIGGNMQFRREVFQRFGAFDENLRFGGTETEFFHRICREKIKFLPERPVFHNYQIHFWDFFKKAFMQGIGRSYIEQRHGNSHGNIFRYGEKALLRELSLRERPATGVAWYTKAFEMGESYYRKKGFTRPGREVIFWCVLKSLWPKRQKSVSIISQWLCIMENFRRTLGSK